MAKRLDDEDRRPGDEDQGEDRRRTLVVGDLVLTVRR
jgi:hypothetical protein